jgi:hypothetical protein
MKRIAFIFFVLVLWLSTCQAQGQETRAPTETTVPTAIPATETTVPPTPTEEPVSAGKLPAPPFDAQTYINEEAGFALDYPTNWTVSETVLGSRANQIQFLSSADLAEALTIPADQARISAVLYQWDPRNDLDAYVEQRKTAWDASGSTILEEQELTLELGLPAVLFTIQAPDSQVVVLIAALRDQYLVISGEGDLDLAKQIMERVRPISQ